MDNGEILLPPPIAIIKARYSSGQIQVSYIINEVSRNCSNISLQYERFLP